MGMVTGFHGDFIKPMLVTMSKEQKADLFMLVATSEEKKVDLLMLVAMSEEQRWCQPTRRKCSDG